MKKTINDILEQEKKTIIANESLVNKIGMEVWDKVIRGKHITIRARGTDHIIECVKKLPLLTYYNDYKDNVIKQLNENEKAVSLVANFMVNATAEELNFFVSQMNEGGDTAWFVNDYLFAIPKLHDAINTIIENGEIEKVKALFAFAYDDIRDLRLTERTHPNSFTAYAEGRTSPEMTTFFDNYLNCNAIIFNDYLVNVQEECLDYSSPKQFFEEIAFYNSVKQFDYEDQIKTPEVLFKAYLLFKKLNESKVWKTEEMFSVNKFVERDNLRRKYDDFTNTQESQVQKLYKEITTPEKNDDLER